MIGKANILILSVLSLLFFPCVARALTVSDPTSYTYYAKQLQEMQRQMQQMQQQVQKQIETINELRTVQTKLESVKSQMTGAYNSASGVLSNLSRLKGIAEKTPSSIKAQGQKWHDIMADGSGMVNPGTYLEKVFSDPRTARTDGTLYKRLDQVYSARQAALRTSIEESDKLLQGMPVRYQRIADLAGRIDQTENIKAAQDLTNAILIELLAAFTDFMAVDARFKEARGLLDFSGVTEGGQGSGAELVKNPPSKTNAFERSMENKGARKQPSNSDFNNLFK